MRLVSKRMSRLFGLAGATATVAALSVVGPVATATADVLPTPAPIEQRAATAASADALPTVQIDTGVVWAQAVSGNTVYAGGDFSNARPAGSERGRNLVPRSNLLAYDVTTGQLIDSFAPQVNGVVRAIAASPDGSRIYVGGDFTSVNGKARWRLAAFDAKTGALLTEWQPVIGGTGVYAIATTDTAVYVGGNFTQARGVARKNLAAFDLGGNLLGWAPTTSGPNTAGQVDAMVVAPKGDKVVLGGRFGRVNGAEKHGLAAVSATDGTLLPWASTNTIRNGGFGSVETDAGISALSTDGTNIFGTAWVWRGSAAGNLEGAFSIDPNTGAIRWIDDCHGDNYSGWASDTQFYLVGHPHQCNTIGGWPTNYDTPSGEHQNSLALTKEAMGTVAHSTSDASYTDWGGKPAPAIIAWFPSWVTGYYTGQGQAGWSITGNEDYVVVGGEFQKVDGRSQYGLVRFARSGADRTNIGPEVGIGNPTAVARPGGAALTVTASWDRDDRDLYYELYRSGTTAPVARKLVASAYWSRPSVTVRDTSATPGQAYTYRMAVVDGDGNRVWGTGSPTVTVPTTAVPASSAYSDAVMADNPSLYYRLGGPSNTAALDWAGGNDGTVQGGVSSAPDGAISGDSGTASRFNGSSNGFIASQRITPPGAYSAELWLRTTTTRGGMLLQRGDSQFGTSGSHDRIVYMLNDGRLRYGVWPGSVKTITSTKSYNDGKWHQVAVTNGPTGTILYVDGAQVAVDTTVTSGENTAGYWRIGGDSLAGWPDRPTSDYFAGDIDELAVYGTVLTPAQVNGHYLQGTDVEKAAPAADFTAAASDLTVAVDASTSKALGTKSIASFSWDFGDGSTGTGVTASHTYATAGERTVTLKVTDSKGYASTATRVVSTTAPLTPYGKAVAADGAALYWRLGAPLSSTAKDMIGSNNGTVGAGVTPGQSSAIDGDSDGASTFSGASNGFIASQKISAPAVVSQELWFRTTSTRGGKLIGRGDAATGSSGSYDRNLYLRSDGRLQYGVWNGTITTVTSAKAYNDGVWHHAVATNGPTGTLLYVDGAQVAGNTSVTTAENTAGYWRVGGDSLSGWPDRPGSDYFAGDIDEVAVYLKVLTPAQVANHHQLGIDVAKVPPTATFAAKADGTTVSFDATGSTAAGTKRVTSYAWDFGDGSTGTGATVSHTYATDGTYQIKLTVTDSAGYTASTTQSVRASLAPDPADAYPAIVKADGATLYWRLGGSAAEAGKDQVGSNDAVTGSTVASAPSGALGSNGGKGSRFDGTSNGIMATSKSVLAPGAVSQELWFSTTTTKGGKLIGRGDSQKGSSGSNDRNLWLRNDGRIEYGTWFDTVHTVTSSKAYNDGTWHHVVATNGTAGTYLYVDGVLVAADPTWTLAENTGGYWRVGGDNMSGWPDLPGSYYAAADLDEVAVYPVQLTRSQVAAHYAAGVGNVAPATADVLVARSGGGAVAVGSAGTWSVSDGSTTWTASAKAPFVPAVVSSVNGYTYAANGSLLAVRSPAGTWTSLKAPGVLARMYVAIDAGGSRCINVLVGSAWYWSTNDGDSWQRFTANGMPSVFADLDTSGSTGVAVNGASVWRTTNWGNAWTARTALPNSTGQLIAASDAALLAWGSDGTWWRSTDSGSTWVVDTVLRAAQITPTDLAGGGGKTFVIAAGKVTYRYDAGTQTLVALGPLG